MSSYDLFIDLDFQGLTFIGTLGATMKTESDVVFDAVGLDIKRVHCGNREFPFDMKNDGLEVRTGAFEGLLEIEYAGKVPDSLAGIYRAPYDGTHIVTTHFEAAQARRMFPCIDRPDVKAEFKLSVRINRELQVISNMPIQSEIDDGSKKIVTFQTTPRMSTYLLYLGVGDFEVRSSKIEETEVVVATTPGKIGKTSFAEAEAKKALAFFNSYYRIPYALPKVHLVAVPEFAMGAMENWGAITFRELLLLVDENTSSRTKIRAAMAIAHELAHQWFGDLVTMKWWDDIWLNESFATYMAYKAIDHAHPEWRIWENFFNGPPNAESLVGAMEQDFLNSTHPIHVPVNSPDEIEQIFDAISYGKGAHVLQMINAYVGEDAFREGVHNYLSAHAYSNAKSEDLWSAIEEASGKPVKGIMSTWVQQAGFPLVTVRLDGRSLKLSQERFLISGKPSGETWPIPILIDVNGQRKNLLIKDSATNIEVGDLKTLRINPDRTGFYAVNIEAVGDLVWSSKPTPFDRWGIVFNSFLLLVSGGIKFRDYMAVLDRFEVEDSTLPAQEVSDELAVLYTLAPSRISEVSKRFHHALLETFLNRSDERSSILRGVLATRLAEIDNEYAARLARDFGGYLKVDPDMRAAVATAYAKSTSNIDPLINAFRNTGSDEDRVKLLSAMTVFTNAPLLERTLDFAMSSEVKRQDKINVVVGAAWNPHTRDRVWAWIKSNIGRLDELYRGTGILSSIFPSVIPVLCVGRVTEAQKFFGEHKISGADVGIRMGLEKLRAYDRLAREISGHG